jgi:putative transposase
MNPPKVDELDYIHFLIAAQKVFTCTEAARSAPENLDPPAHDAFTRLLRREPPDTEALWEEAKTLVEPERGVLVVDDTTLDKPYSRKIELVHRHWSGKHHQVVSGINLCTLLWSEVEALVPTDFRIYDAPHDGLTKNDHFRAMLQSARERGFRPRYVLFDSWYSSLDNLKAIRGHGWRWLGRLKSNRLVNPDKSGNTAIRKIEIGPEGRIVHLKAYGMVKVFRTVDKDGDAEYWATDDLKMSEQGREELERSGWSIETYHRALKQCCGIEKSQARGERAQRNHLGLSLRAFLRLEANRLESGVSWYEAKLSIVRGAVRKYLAEPLYLLNATA